MRCLGWLSLIVLAFARRASCFIVRNFPSHQSRVQLNCCNVRVVRGTKCIASGRGHTCPLRASAHDAVLSLRGRQVWGVIHGCFSVCSVVDDVLIQTNCPGN